MSKSDDVGNRAIAKKVLHWIPAALAVVMIAGESTATMSSSNTSRWLLPIWIHFFGPISAARWDEVHHLIRKIGHFIGYGVVSLCFFHGWRTTLTAVAGELRLLWRRSALLAIGSTLVVACADEFHQSFLPGRTSSPVDVGIDVCGAIAAQFLVYLLMPLILRNRQLAAVSA
jgi:VanZ family protein